MEDPKKVLTKPIEEYDAMREALAGLAEGTKDKYFDVMPRFCEFVGKDPDTIIRERREHERSPDVRTKRTYERAIVNFYEHLKRTPSPGRKKPMCESSAFINVAVVRGFFSRNYCKTAFKRGDLRAPKTESLDYNPTLGEIREICDVADIRDKAVIILALQTGMAPVDLVDLKRPDFERALKSDEFPQSLGWLQRSKSREEFHPFLFRDSATALKRYLQNRKDDSPYLFVDRFGKQLKERNVNEIFTKAAKRAGIAVPPSKRLRIYCLRSVFETQMQNAGVPQTWTDMMMGHVVGGSRGKYAKPSEADWLKKVRKAERFISISLVQARDDVMRQGDMLELFMFLEKKYGREGMERMVKGYMDLRSKGVEVPVERSKILDVCKDYLALGPRKSKEQTAPRKRKGKPTLELDKVR